MTNNQKKEKPMWGFHFTQREVMLIAKKCGTKITRAGHKRWMDSVKAEVAKRLKEND